VYGASYVRPPRLPIPLDRSLEDGERLDWAGLEIHALLTPGNSPGGMTYTVQIGERKAVFSGGIMHAGSRMVNWFDTEWDYGFAKGIDVLQESVDRLMKTEIDLLLPAYGPSVGNPREQLTTYREKLANFRASYLRGYPVFDLPRKDRDPVSTPTAVPGLSQVTPHLYKLHDSEKGWNFAIIISDEGRGLILDCGLLPREMLEELIVGMRQHLGLKQIDAFWISHMHGDHFLLGPLLREKYGAQSWTLDRVVDPIENPRRYDYAALIPAYGDGFDGMPIDKAFQDGESIEWEGYRIQVDWMPGQTEFGCSLWLELDGQRIVFTGDNLFGNPADPDQDGHEAVVARNSCIFEEGYLHAAKYLLELEPDLIMGSHSFVMPNPRSFLQRYYNWAREIIAIYRDLLPDTHYEYRFDPYWVSAYPYRVGLTDSQPKPVGITVRNFRDRPQQHRILIRTPPESKQYHRFSREPWDPTAAKRFRLPFERTSNRPSRESGSSPSTSPWMTSITASGSIL
jgi:glyoxylase-like metal-dependent hydrolase (beta-lactamase superfamily II)